MASAAPDGAALAAIQPAFEAALAGALMRCPEARLLVTPTAWARQIRGKSEDKARKMPATQAASESLRL
jgi:hypothetical protein